MIDYLTPSPAFTWTETTRTTTAKRGGVSPGRTPAPSVKPRPRSHLRRLVLENTRLRARQVEAVALSSAKDEALREYVNHRIAATNAAIRTTNGPRPGESSASYNARLVAANQRPLP